MHYIEAVGEMERKDFKHKITVALCLAHVKSIQF